MQEAEMKHQLPTPLTCRDHAWSPTCQAGIRLPELCCAVCLVHTHGWNLGSLHAWHDEGAIPAGPWGLQKSYKYLKANFTKTKFLWWKVGPGKFACTYIFEKKPYGNSQEISFLHSQHREFFLRKYMSFICQKSRNPNTRCLNSKMSKRVRSIKKLQKEKSLNPLSGR